jgi:cell division protein ZapA
MSNPDDNRKVVVRIFGEEYPITGAGDPQHISRIADLVDVRMREVARSSRSQAKDKVAILAAMSIASELQEKKSQLNRVSGSTDDRIETLIARLDEALEQSDTA